jgi:hypothetical protein
VKDRIGTEKSDEEIKHIVRDQMADDDREDLLNFICANVPMDVLVGEAQTGTGIWFDALEAEIAVSPLITGIRVQYVGAPDE